MKLVSLKDGGPSGKAALYINNKVFALADLGENLEYSMRQVLDDWDSHYERLLRLSEKINDDPGKYPSSEYDENNLMAPVPQPTSCRDGYAFRQHVATARRNRGVPMIPEFDLFPIFYFTNHLGVSGPGDVEVMPDHLRKLDFELEAAIVLGRRGKNIRASQADEHIAGYMVMNDLSARHLQMEEMKLNLGPAKGKDFATAIGPWLVTRDELGQHRVPTKEGHEGEQFDLKMTGWVNGVQVSEGNLRQMDWTFAEIVERASYGTELVPGEVIGSGTVGTGCFLELNGSGLLANADYKPQWLQDGDTMKMEIEALGSLQNRIVKSATDWSILAKYEK